MRKILEFEKEEAYTANQALKVTELEVVKDMGWISIARTIWEEDISWAFRIRLW